MLRTFTFHTHTMPHWMPIDGVCFQICYFRSKQNVWLFNFLPHRVWQSAASHRAQSHSNAGGSNRSKIRVFFLFVLHTLKRSKKHCLFRLSVFFRVGIRRLAWTCRTAKVPFGFIGKSYWLHSMLLSNVRMCANSRYSRYRMQSEQKAPVQLWLLTVLRRHKRSAARFQPFPLAIVHAHIWHVCLCVPK